jgi:hypothetical protein
VINGVASLGNAAIHHPGGMLAAAGGIGLTALSAAGEGAGVVLDATGDDHVSPVNAGDGGGADTGQTTEGDSPPNQITGRTVHGDQQALSRDGGHGVSDEAMNDAVQNRTKPPAPQPGGRYKFVGKNATVILNSAGKFVTTWARNSAGWRNP